MTIQTVRRLAADIFRVGENKVRINPDSLKEAEGALTRSDVRSLIEKGIVTKAKPLGRASTAKIRRRGHGRRRGSSTQDSKALWMIKVRSQRTFLAMLVTTGAVKKEFKRMLYYKVKSGIFRNKRAMLLYLKDNKMVAADYEPKSVVKTSQKNQISPKTNQTSTSNESTSKTDVSKKETKKEKSVAPVDQKTKESTESRGDSLTKKEINSSHKKGEQK